MDVHPHTNLITQVDRTKDPDFFVRFMDEAQKSAGIRAGSGGSTYGGRTSAERC